MTCSDKAVAAIDPRDRAAIARAVAPLARQYGVEVRLFGSRARGDARRVSDIDLALCASQPLPLAALAQIRQSLEDSPVPFRIDVVDYARASPDLRRAIDEEGVPWTV